MLQAIYLGKLHTPLLPLFCTKKHMCCSSFGIKNEKHSTEDRSRFLFFSGASPSSSSMYRLLKKRASRCSALDDSSSSNDVSVT